MNETFNHLFGGGENESNSLFITATQELSNYLVFDYYDELKTNPEV